MTLEQQTVEHGLSTEQQAWLDNPDFIRILGLKLGLMWQDRATERDRAFKEEWEKKSFWQKWFAKI